MTYTGLENFTDDELIKKIEIDAQLLATVMEKELAKRLDERNEEVRSWKKWEAELKAKWPVTPRPWSWFFK